MARAFLLLASLQCCCLVVRGFVPQVSAFVKSKDE
jgi:hypothetical protein